MQRASHRREKAVSDLNGKREELAVSTVADTIEERASEWIEQRDFGDWDEDYQRELGAWLAQSIAHRVAFVRLDFEWQRTGRLAVLRSSEPQSSINDSSRRVGISLFRIAAAMLLVATVVGGAIYLRPPHDEIYATSVGGHKTVTFSDGSQIELNTDTVLRVRMADNRSVTLEKGEAYFQIRHDATRPFVVTVANHSITDLGTKFLLRTALSGMEVALIEGRARVDTASLLGSGQSATLKAGDVAVATADAISVVKKSKSDLTNELSWRQGLLVFHHATLEEAASQFNRYNTGKIVIADPKIARLAFSATLPLNDVEAFTRVAEKLFDIRSQKRGDETVISR
jgi:transmembrane sensor